MGLKAGDEVMISIEGESLKISPSGVRERRVVEIKDPRLSRYALPCAYILGYDNVIIDLGRSGSVNGVRESASELLGVKLEPLGDGRAEAKIVIDHDVIDLRDLVSDLRRSFSEAVRLVEASLAGRDVREELANARREFYSIRSLTERLMHTSTASTMERRYFLTIFTSLTLVGLATSILHDIARDRPSSSLAPEALRRLGEIGETLCATVLSPSQLRLGQALSALESLDLSLRSAGREDPMVYRLLDVIKIMQIIAYSLLCYAMVKRGDE